MTISKKVVQEIIKLRNYKHIHEIAEELNISKNTVTKYIKLCKAERTCINPELNDEIIERLKNESLTFVSKFYNIPFEKIKLFKEKNNIKKNPIHKRKYSYEYLIDRAKISNDVGTLILELSSIYKISTISKKTLVNDDVIRNILKSKNIIPLKSDIDLEMVGNINDQLSKKYNITNEQIDYIIKYYPHFSANTLSKELNIETKVISSVKSKLNLTKLPPNERLCISCKINLREIAKSYGSSCKECHLKKMIEYQKEYYPHKMKLKYGQNKNDLLSKIYSK